MTGDGANDGFGLGFGRGFGREDGSRGRPGASFVFRETFVRAGALGGSSRKNAGSAPSIPSAWGLTAGDARISLAVGRLLGSRLSMRACRSLSSGLSRRGEGGAYAPRRMFITSAGSERPSNARAPAWHSSYRMHPSAHTSDFSSYRSPVHISGER